MYTNIMIPVSFDEDRDTSTAIKAALTLASPGARLTFVHVFEMIPAYASDAIPAEIFVERRQDIERRLEEYQKEFSNANAVLLDGSAGRCLTEWAKENNADCIVIASHRPSMADIFLGSTAAWVVRHADCAVHVIR